ncbi:MAG: arsenate reductase ArsC [Eubacterium sp.]
MCCIKVLGAGCKSCRSQIAEVLGKHFTSDRYNIYSTGTETKPQINQDAVRIVKQLYGIDISNQYSKTIDDIPTPDIAISMGCDVGCPFINGGFDDWGLPDPTGKSDDENKNINQIIKAKILNYGLIIKPNNKMNSKRY